MNTEAFRESTGPSSRWRRRGGSESSVLCALLFLTFSIGCHRQKSPPVGSSARAAERLITIGGPITEIVFALGHGEAVVGVDTSSVFPPQVKRLPQVGYQRTLTAEGVLALRPTRVIVTDEAGPAAALAQLRSAGIPLEVIPSTPTLAGCRNKIEKVASLLGEPASGALLLARLNAELAQAPTSPPEHPPRVLFLYTRGAGTLLVAGADTNAAAMIQLAGAENAAAAVHGFKPFSAEALLGARPDVLLLTRRGLESLGGPQAVYQLPGLAALSIEKRPRIITQDDLLLLGFGPRTGEAIRELRAKLDQPTALAPPASSPPEPPQQLVAAAGSK